MFFRKLRILLNNLSGFFYYHHANLRNCYAYKLLGKKYANDEHEHSIVFRKSGETRITEMPVKEVTVNPSLIAQFHPTSALKIGIIALEELVYALPKETRRQQFINIKKSLLNSTLTDNMNNAEKPQLLNFPSLDTQAFSLNIKNTHPFKMAGGKCKNKNLDTIIIYTIFGRREGHEKLLKELIDNNALIEKFHPIDAFKLGFIFRGDDLFFSPSEPIDPYFIKCAT